MSRETMLTSIIETRLNFRCNRALGKSMPNRIVLILLVFTLLTGCTLSSQPDDDSREATIPTTPTDEGVATQTRAPFATRTPAGTPAPSVPTPLPNPAQTQPGSSPANPTTAGSGSAGGLRTVNIAAPAAGSHGLALTTNGSTLSSAGVPFFNNVTTFYFAQNPAAPARYAVIDTTGLLYLTEPGGVNASRIEQGPYTQFPADSRANNNAAADVVAWSPDGQFVGFIVNGNQQASDGVWYFQPGQFAPLQLIVDCPTENFPGCLITTPPDTIRRWESLEIHWSPDSQALLVNADLPELGRRGLMVAGVTRSERVRDNRPAMILYDTGTWSNDGRILASGRNPEGLSEVALLNRDGSLAQSVAQGGTLWLGWAAQQPDGDIYALGRSGEPNGALALYDMNGAALTAPIGDSFPQRVAWSPSREAVLVTVNGRQFVATVSGEVRDITDSANGLPVQWVK